MKIFQSLKDKLKTNKTINNQAKANTNPLKISIFMKFRRFTHGLEKPQNFSTIGEEFKKEINQEKPNKARALEILGKFNEPTLKRILEYNQTSKKI
jgi:hypothetical protein